MKLALLNLLLLFLLTLTSVNSTDSLIGLNKPGSQNIISMGESFESNSSDSSIDESINITEIFSPLETDLLPNINGNQENNTLPAYKLSEISNEFIENISKRNQNSRHFYNESSNTNRYVSDQLVYYENLLPESNWVTFEEYPIRFIIRLTNGSNYKFSEISDITNFFTVINNNSLWGLGLETFNGIMGFYMDFSDTDWGHGQYLYYPRLKNGILPAYNQPQYAIYPHLYVKAGITWFDTLINNRTFYSGFNDPRNHLSFFNQSNEIGLSFKTDLVNIDGFNWNFTQGFKYVNRSYNIITNLVSVDRGWADVGMGYEITTSPQAEGTPYEPEKFTLSNETHEKLINITNLWKANETINNPLNYIEIISENKEVFRFDFDDMRAAGFNKTYLELHNQILPNGVSKKTLLAGMFNYGSYIQNTLIEIDPTFSSKQSNDERDFDVDFDGDVYGVRTSSADIDSGFTASDIQKGFFAFDTGITETISSISNVIMTIFQLDDNSLNEIDEYMAIGVYYNNTLDGGYWNETHGTTEDAAVFNQELYWNDTSFYLPSAPNQVNKTMDTIKVENLLNNWTAHHNIDPTNRQFIPLILFNGSGMDEGTTDRWETRDAGDGTPEEDATITFDYITDFTPPNITSPANQTINIGVTGEQIQWQAWDDNPNNFSIYRNGTNINNGTWSNGQLINQSLDGLGVVIWNFTLFVNDTAGNSNTSTVWVTISEILMPELDSPPDQTLEAGYNGKNITWVPIERDNSTDQYFIYRNGSLVLNGTWTNLTPIIIDIDNINLTLGLFNFTILINDTINAFATDTVFITVQDTTSPVLDSPSDLSFAAGTLNNWINWTTTDLFPANYSVYQNDSIFSNGSWLSGNPINISLDIVLEGFWNFTMVVNDTSSNEAADLVFVNVTAYVIPNITQILIHENETSPFDYVSANSTNGFLGTVFYSNDQTMNTTLTISVFAVQGVRPLLTGNTSQSWGNSENVTISPSTTFNFTFNYFIEQTETSNDINISIYDNNNRFNSSIIKVQLDNTNPTNFNVTIPFTESGTSDFVLILEPPITDGISGLYNIWLNISTITTTSIITDLVSGINYLSHDETGVFQLNITAIDNVGNKIEADNNDVLFLQLTVPISIVDTGTQTVDRDIWNPFPDIISLALGIIPYAFMLLGLIIFFRMLRK